MIRMRREGIDASVEAVFEVPIIKRRNNAEFALLQVAVSFQGAGGAEVTVTVAVVRDGTVWEMCSIEGYPPSGDQRWVLDHAKPSDPWVGAQSVYVISGGLSGFLESGDQVRVTCTEESSVSVEMSQLDS